MAACLHLLTLPSYPSSCCIGILLETLTPEVSPQAVQHVPFLLSIQDHEKKRDIFSRSFVTCTHLTWDKRRGSFDHERHRCKKCSLNLSKSLFSFCTFSLISASFNLIAFLVFLSSEQRTLLHRELGQYCSTMRKPVPQKGTNSLAFKRIARGETFNKHVRKYFLH